MGDVKLTPKFRSHRLCSIKNYRKVCMSATKPLASVAEQTAICCTPAMLASGFLGNLYVN